MTTNITLNVNENGLRTFASLVANSLTTEVTNRQANDSLLDTKIESLKERLESLNTNYVLTDTDDSGSVTGLISSITQTNGLISIETSNKIKSLIVGDFIINGKRIRYNSFLSDISNISSYKDEEYVPFIIASQLSASARDTAKAYTDTQIANLFTYSNGILTINI